MLVVLAGGEGDVAFEGAEGAGGGARRGKRQGEQEEKAMVAHDLALFGLLRGFHGQLEKWANFGVDRGRLEAPGFRGLPRLLCIDCWIARPRHWTPALKSLRLL